MLKKDIEKKKKIQRFYLDRLILRKKLKST